jgi:YspA, cpYpsA-related SLOG family
MAAADHFPPPGKPGFAARSKMLGARHPPLRFGPAGAIPFRPRPLDRREGRDGRGRSSGRKAPAMTHNGNTLPFLDSGDPDAEQHPASPTAHLLDELALYGYRQGQDEPDPRPLPEPDIACRHIEAAVEAIEATLTGTRLEDDLADLLWSFVNLFHRKIDRMEAALDRNEQAQRRSQTEQNGSEVKSVELERLIDEGTSLIERRNAFEFFRDHAAELFQSATGSAWRPLAGSMVNRRALTAAMIDSREFIAARRRADAEVLAPSGPRIAFTGGADCNDHPRIWDALDKVRTKHPDMVLLHGGSPRGAERIAACWADNRQVPQVVFKPDWTRHRNAAPFKRNDRMLEALPIGVVVFPGSGIAANLADKAKQLGIPVWRFNQDGAA